MISKSKFFFVFFVLLPFVAFSQNIRRARGYSQVKMEANMSRIEVQKIAEEQAKIDAIQSVFGSYVQKKTDLTVINGQTDFNIIGSTKVRGVWIRTHNIEFKDDSEIIKGKYGLETEIWITCTIDGDIRQSTPGASLEYLTLNGVSKNNRTTTFLSGENLYMWFRSPINGFLCIFLDDGEMVYRLLPYSNSNNQNSTFIKADKEYIFFSKSQKLNKDESVDEIELYTSEKNEKNIIYIIFSANDYLKPILENSDLLLIGGYSLPKKIKRNKFDEWLSSYKEKYDDFIDIQISIDIISDIICTK